MPTRAPSQSLHRFKLAPTGRARPPRARAALTLAEAVVATGIVGVLLVAALDSVGALRQGRALMHDRQTGLLLAQDLLSEICVQHYADPELGPGSMGLGTDEITGTRALFEDVDDYDGWSASPPQETDGTDMIEFIGWRRQVTVDWVMLSNPNVISAEESGLKRIIVSVYHNNALVAQQRAWRGLTIDDGRSTE